MHRVRRARWLTGRRGVAPILDIDSQAARTDLRSGRRVRAIAGPHGSLSDHAQITSHLARWAMRRRHSCRLRPDSSGRGSLRVRATSVTEKLFLRGPLGGETLSRAAVQSCSGRETEFPESNVRNRLAAPLLPAFPLRSGKRQSDQIGAAVTAIGHNLSHAVCGSRLLQPDTRSDIHQAVQIHHAAGIPQDRMACAAGSPRPSHSQPAGVNPIRLALAPKFADSVRKPGFTTEGNTRCFAEESAAPRPRKTTVRKKSSRLRGSCWR